MNPAEVPGAVSAKSHHHRPLRVIQWATGTVGSRALRNVISRTDMELVGVRVHDSRKRGMDAGALCGSAVTGVTATDDVEEILRIEADCVLYMQQGCDIEDVCRILASGKNIVTTRTEFHNPASLDPTIRARVEAACQQGGTSIYSTGSSPGFITEALPLALFSVQSKLDGMLIDEFADMSVRNSPDMIFNIMGFGKELADFNSRRVASMEQGFAHSLRMVADAVGAPIEAVEISSEVAAARRDIQLVAGFLPAGTVAGQRITVAGVRQGRAFISFRANWYCTRDLEADWDLRETGWRVQLRGDAPLDIAISNPVSPEELGLVAPNKTPNRAVNAVPYVCAAAPGIRTTIELPHILPRLAATSRGGGGCSSAIGPQDGHGFEPTNGG